MGAFDFNEVDAAIEKLRKSVAPYGYTAGRSHGRGGLDAVQVYICKTERDGYLAAFTLEYSLGLPYIISTGLFVRDGYNVLTDKLDACKFEIAKAVGTRIIASVHADNPRELARMFKGGWKQIDTVVLQNEPSRLIFVKTLS